MIIAVRNSNPSNRTMITHRLLCRNKILDICRILLLLIIIKYLSFLFELLSTVTRYATRDFRPFPWTFPWCVVECDKASETTSDWVLYFVHKDNRAESGYKWEGQFTMKRRPSF
jgi:hypothetical protein